MTPPNDLLDAAVRLRNAAPGPFQEFVKVFAAYTQDVTVTVTEASAENILKAQGMAVEARVLLRMFEETEARAARAARAGR